MIVKNTVSPLWALSAEALDHAAQRLAAILSEAPAGTEIFFRADDIGIPGNKCRQMMDVFCAHSVPLHMAVTPAWLGVSRWETLKSWGEGADIWCWHQHGWRHVNHQMSGKKGEFGTDRSRAAKKADIARGRAKLESIMGDDFRPVFTPPWNRFDTETGEILAELGFTAVSRSAGEQKKVSLPDSLPDIPINVDLHTRSEADPAEGMDELLREFEIGVRDGRIGVMLHHQRMNDAAVYFLDACLGIVAKTPALVPLRINLL